MLYADVVYCSWYQLFGLIIDCVEYYILSGVACHNDYGYDQGEPKDPKQSFHK